MLRDDAEYQAALKDVEDLAGCLEGTEEEAEMIKLCLAIAVYEARLGIL